MAGGKDSPGKPPQPAGPAPPAPPASPALPRARGQSARQISVARRARRRRVLLLVCGLMSSLVLLFSAAAWGLASYANGAVGRIFAGTAGGLNGPLNVLLAGVDVRAGLTPAQQRVLHVGDVPSSNSDTLMLIHIAGDRSSVTVVSLPRDSWVFIPGHGMNKINAAFGLGGPRLTVADRRAGHRADHQRLHRGQLPRLRQGHRRARRGEHLPAAAPWTTPTAGCT